jgi:N-acetylated-alpha-linked acidic dipeptidase
MNRSLLVLVILLFTQSSFSQKKNITGFYNKNIEKELDLESAFDKNLSKENIGETIKKLSAEPHNISSPGDKKNAEYILSMFLKWGWDAKIETY